VKVNVTDRSYARGCCTLDEPGHALGFPGGHETADRFDGPDGKGHRVIVPGSALAQAIRDPVRQARLARLLRQPLTEVVALDRVDATGAGRLLAASGTSDIADAHVVVCARRSNTSVVTSDPDDLRALDPTLKLDVL
jgi:hypothetical protein